jgi:hypothetical protein
MCFGISINENLYTREFGELKLKEILKNTQKVITQFNLKEVFDYEKYLDYMNSKIVKNPRTFTMLDYMSDADVEEARIKRIRDLSIYDPTPEHIKKHLDYSINLYLNLKDSHKEDGLIKILGTEEVGTILIASTNWYERFGFKYKNDRKNIPK